MKRIKEKVLFTIISLIGFIVFAQYEASNWYFGENAGISFNLGSNTVTKTSNGQINTREGCSSISDEFGDLLFYTDGVTVWNKNHLQMLNGFGLNGDSSSTQSAIIVPKPADPDIYYVFTVDNALDRLNFGLNYSEINISLDGGLGEVVVKNTNLLPLCSEKVTAVLKDCITRSIWVVTFASENGNNEFFNTFHAFEVSDTGVNTTSVKSNFGSVISDSRGYLKLSPDGTKVASANARDGLFIYDFDVNNGLLSNERNIQINSNNGSTRPYGVEFSPNSNLLYVHSSNDFFDMQNPSNSNNPANHSSVLTQFNLLESDIEGTQITIDQRQLYRGGLQLGPNGKIYRALSASYTQGLPYLGVIENPNIVGSGCNYTHNAINLSPSNSSQGLPPFIASFFNTQIDIIKNGESAIVLDLCEGETYTLISENITGATYTWLRDKATLADTDYDLDVNQSGHYELFIDPNNGDCIIEGQAFVVINENPKVFNHTLLQCDEDGLNDGFTLFNLNEAINDLTGSATNMLTKFYLDIGRLNEVNGDNFSNTSNPQTIYVEVINTKTSCFSYSELQLEVSLTDSKDAVLPPVCDDDGIEDGFHVFNLSDADNMVLNGLTTSMNIGYYVNYNDALLEQNKLNTSFTNTIPHSQKIYARVENDNNCYGISEVLLTVNKLPDINLEQLKYYCLNNFPNTIYIDAAVLNDSPNNYTYNWTSGETTYEIQINQIGTYIVSVTNASGCSKERKISVEASNLATIENLNVIDASQNNTIAAVVSGEGIYEYSLIDSSNIIISPFQESNEFENIAPGIYTLAVRDKKNNCGIANTQVSVIGFPKFFSPNNDGFNDTWQLYGVSEMFQNNSIIYIYNRYGKLLKQLSPLQDGWDGTFNGNKLPSDDYWFVVTLQDGRIFKNHFTLIY